MSPFGLLYRKVFLTSLLIVVLGMWLGNGLSARPSHAISPNGILYAWGGNSNGQVGDGTNIKRTTPVAVNLPSGVTPTAIAAGYSHSLTDGNDGKLYAWGNNTFGQLGDGTNTNRTTPVVVGLPTGVIPTGIASGIYHSLAMGSNGKLYAWGYNVFGQLGDGTNTDRTSPVVVGLPAGVTATAIAGGIYHSLATGSNGKLYAWGNNGQGQLGDGNNSISYTPVVVGLPAGVSPVAISAGQYHNLAIGTDGKLYAWGADSNGQLGDGATTDQTTPIVISLPGGATPTAISAGGDHSMAIGSDGKLYVWGENNLGQVGNATTTDQITPLAINLASGVSPTMISAGYFHSLAEGSDGKLYAWGDNSYGELGDGTITTRHTPVLASLPGGTSPTAISAGSDHTLAVIPPPSLSINNVSQAEGNSGTTSFTFTVTLSYAISQTVTVDYATADGTATAPGDYTATSGTLTFAPGTITQTVSVLVNGDTVIEPDKTFLVNLSNPTVATIAMTQGTGTIVNDDICPPLVVTAITDDGTGSNCGTLSYSLSQPITVSTPVTVTFALTQGNTITFTGSLTTTAKVKAGVTIFGGAFGSSTRVIFNGNGVSGDGLHLAGNNYLINITIEHFGGREMVLENPGNRMQGVVVIAS